MKPHCWLRTIFPVSRIPSISPRSKWDGRVRLKVEELDDRITPTATLSTVTTGFTEPTGVVVGPNGSIYATDLLGNFVAIINPTTKNGVPFAGDGSSTNSGDGGPATQAAIETPYGLALDSSGNLYITTDFGDTVREVNAATGIITTIAGDGQESGGGSNGDGGSALSAHLGLPQGIAIDSHNNIYITDQTDGSIREVNASTSNISTVVSGLASPSSLAVDSHDNLYIADNTNNVVLKYDTLSGTTTTFAGNGTAGTSGDGGLATKAELDGPWGVAVNKNGDVFISLNKGNTIREVNGATGIITTIAGNGVAGDKGDNGPATSGELNNPLGMAVDSAGNLYFADEGNDVLRELTFPAAAQGTLKFETQPASILDPGDKIPAVKVQVTGSGIKTVTLALGSSPSGAKLTGNTTAQVIGGVATFTGLSVSEYGQHYTLTATGGDASATSAAFKVGPTLVVKAPDEVAPGVDFTTIVEAIDPITGAVDTTFTGQQVTLELSSTTLADALTGLTIAQAKDGIARFSNALGTVGDVANITASNPSLATSTPKAVSVFSEITLTWTGLGSNGLWSNPNNWKDNNNTPLAPQPGDSYILNFPNGAPQEISTDNVANLTADLALHGAYDFVGGTPLTLNSLIVSPGTIGAIDFGMGIVLPGSTNVSVTKTALVEFSSGLSGSGGLQLSGPGRVFFAATSTYTGGTTLAGGGILLAPVADPLGAITSIITGPAAGAAASIRSGVVGTAPITLLNPLNLQGGTIRVLAGPKLRLLGQITFNADSEIDAADGESVLLGGIAGTGTLTLGSFQHAAGAVTGEFSLAGTVASPVTVKVTGAAQLIGNAAGTDFSGTGTLTLMGGTLTGVVTGSISGFTGAVNILTGQVDLSGTNALGAGQVTLGNGSSTGVITIIGPATGTVAKLNDPDFNGGVLKIRGNITFTGLTTLETSSTIVSVITPFKFTLAGGITSNGGMFTLADLGSGILSLGGTLDSSIVVVPARKNLRDTGLIVTGAGVIEDAKGDILDS
jgi:autotransporter-associated beta strand protein